LVDTRAHAEDLEEVDLRLDRIGLRPVEEGRDEAAQHLRGGVPVTRVSFRGRTPAPGERLSAAPATGEHCRTEVGDHPLIDLAEEVLQGGARLVEIALVRPGRLTDVSDSCRALADGSDPLDPGGDGPLAPGALPRLAAGPGVGASSTYHAVILTSLGGDCK